MISRRILHAIKRIQRYSLSPFVLNDLLSFRSTQGVDRFPTRFKDIYPCVRDKTVATGFDRHYVYHTAWAARVVREIDPPVHVDISSSLYFCAMLSAFIPVDFYDYRPADLTLSGLRSKEGDLHHLPFKDDSVASISCMHTIEHVGLGRYGDPIDAEGDLKALQELKRVVAPGGRPDHRGARRRAEDRIQRPSHLFLRTGHVVRVGKRIGRDGGRTIRTQGIRFHTRIRR